MSAEYRHLTDCIDKMYRQFKAAPPGRWSGDDLGVAEADWRALSSLPLRQVTRGHIWTFDDLTPHPPIREVRYLLPRWFELIAQGQLVRNIDLGCELSVLPRAGYPQDWPDRDVALIEEAFAHLLHAVIVSPAKFHFMRFAGVEVGYVEMALNARATIEGVIALLNGLPVETRERIVLNHVREASTATEFPDLDGERRAALAAWVVSQDPVGIVERAFHASNEEASQREFSQLLSGLESEFSKPEEGLQDCDQTA